MPKCPHTLKSNKKFYLYSLECRNRASTEKLKDFGLKPETWMRARCLACFPTGLHLWCWPWPYTESLDIASDSKKKKQHDPSCPHLIPTSKGRERVYEWELNKSISTKALTWGRAECLPCLTQCYLSTVTLTCCYSWGHLRGRQTAKMQANWKKGGEDFHMPLTDLFVDERLHCGLIFFFFGWGDLWLQAWYKLNSDKGVLELECVRGGQFSKTKGQKFCKGQT